MADSIIAKFGMDNSKFKKGVKENERSLKGFAGKIKSVGASMGGLLGVGAFGSMATQAMELSKELDNLATLANTDVETFQKLAAGAKSVSVESDKLSDIYKDVNDKVGDFLQTGGGSMADFFENIAPLVGVTAEQFKNLSGPDALQLYYSSLEKANLSSSEMTFYMEAIASDSTALAPLLRDNGKAFKELGDAADDAGKVMDQEMIDKLKEANTLFEKTKLTITIFAGEALAFLLPFFGSVGNGFKMIFYSLRNGITIQKEFFTFLAKSIGEVIEPAINSFQALAKGIEGSFHAMKGNITEAKQAFDEAKSLGKDSVKEFISIPKDIAKAAMESGKVIKGSMDKTFNQIADLADSQNELNAEMVDNVKGLFSDKEKSSKDANKKIVEDEKKTSNAVKKVKKDAIEKEVKESFVDKEITKAKELKTVLERAKEIMANKNKESTKRDTLSEANTVLKAQGKSDERFTKIDRGNGEYGYQKFKGGSKVGDVYTEEQMQQALDRKLQSPADNKGRAVDSQTSSTPTKEVNQQVEHLASIDAEIKDLKEKVEVALNG